MQDTEIINTAILNGRTVAIPVKVLAIEVTGLIVDISAMVACKSSNEDIIKVGEGDRRRKHNGFKLMVGEIPIQLRVSEEPGRSIWSILLFCTEANQMLSGRQPKQGVEEAAFPY